jgi:hypothetical protein
MSTTSAMIGADSYEDIFIYSLALKPSLPINEQAIECMRQPLPADG